MCTVHGALQPLPARAETIARVNGSPAWHAPLPARQRHTTKAVVKPKNATSVGGSSSGSTSNSRKETTAKPATSADMLPMDLSCSALSSTSRRFFSTNRFQMTSALSRTLCCISFARHSRCASLQKCTGRSVQSRGLLPSTYRLWRWSLAHRAVGFFSTSPRHHNCVTQLQGATKN